MSGIGDDVRFAWRLSRRAPGVMLAAVVALALGIGATTAIFSFVDGVLLRPLPFPNSRKVVAIHNGYGGQRNQAPLSWLDYRDVVAQSTTLESIAAWDGGDVNLSGDGPPERLLMWVVTPSMLPTLGVQPIRGRNFAPGEIQAGHEHVALISYELWQRRFGGRDDALGRTLRLDGVPYDIVGVLPRGFRVRGKTDVWLPMPPSLQRDVRNWHNINVLARPRPGVSLSAVSADLELIGHRVAANHPDAYPPNLGFTMWMQPYLREIVGDVELPLLILLGAVGFVLLIACVNVANLLLARAAARQREMAVRSALGAGRGRIVRQLLTESLLLSLVGGGLGVLGALWAIDALVALARATLPRADEVTLDWRVLGFSVAIAVASGVAFGLVPALSASRTDLSGALKNGTRGSAGGRRRLRAALVVTEVALSTVLLVGAGLMVRSFAKLAAVDPGFRGDHAIMLRVSLPVADNVIGEADKARFVRFFTNAVARLRQLPGVTAAGANTILPLEGSMSDRLFDLDRGRPPDGISPDAQFRVITPGWFAAMGIPIVKGRDVLPSDEEKTEPVVVVNQAFARKFYPGVEVLERRIRLGNLGKQEFPWARIVGVIGDVRGYGLERAHEPEMYWPLAQTRTISYMALVARSKGDPRPLLSMARAAMTELDPGQPIFDLQTVDELETEFLAPRRFVVTLMTLFGLVALVLAAVGIYAVIAYNVAQRTQEIGIRVALGAQPRDVLRMVLRDGMKLVAAGLVLGSLVALPLARLTAALLYGVTATDVATYATIAASLGAVGLLAVLLPARRAMRIDPIEALRTD